MRDTQYQCPLTFLNLLKRVTLSDSKKSLTLVINLNLREEKLWYLRMLFTQINFSAAFLSKHKMIYGIHLLLKTHTKHSLKRICLLNLQNHPRKNKMVVAVIQVC